MLGKWNFKTGSVGFIIICALVVGLLFNPWVGLIAQTQLGCDEMLKQAEKKFRGGHLDEAVTLVNKCLKEKDVTKKQGAQSYAILAKVYLEKNDREQAKSMVNKLLDLQSSFTPNQETDMQSFIDLVQEVKEERGGSIWLWIVGGVAVVGAVVAAVFLSK